MPSQGTVQSTTYELAFVGHYTKDTIVSAAGTRLVDGGAFNYGAHVAARMGLRAAAITRLARKDEHVVTELQALGLDTFVEMDPTSTCLRLVYPTSNVDERIIYVDSMAEPFTVQQVAGIDARAFVIGPSIRGEVGLDMLQALAAKGAWVAVDVQGFVRVTEGNVLRHAPWPEKEAVLAYVDILKTDAVEAEQLTGEADIHRAAQILADLGPAEIVLTHRDGLLVYAQGRYYEAGFYPAQLVGRSGRGDTCLASYVARRLDADLGDATLWAAAVTSLKMETEGPFRRDIQDVHTLLQERYA